MSPERKKSRKSDADSTPSKLLIRHARIIDPANSVDARGDILIRNGRIAAVGKVSATLARGARVVNARGLVAAPGFVDIHTHLREPGPAGGETVLSGARAAVNGGYTTVCSMPNTDPPVDSPERVAYQRLLGQRAGYARVYPVCAITVGRAGEALVEMASCAAEGAVAFTDDGAALPTAKMVVKALLYAKVTGLPIIEHPEDASLSGSGVAHKGSRSAVLGLTGISASSEDVIVARDCIIAKETNGRLHLTHLSTSGAVEILSWAKSKGVSVTADVTPHHLVLDDSGLERFHTSIKVKPPLRSKDHIQALRKALVDGTVDCIATDHAPHRLEEKEVEFDYAAFGLTGLETAFAVLNNELVEAGIISLPRLIDLMSARPARVLNLPAGTLSVGAAADVVLLDPKAQWLVDTDKLLSAGANCPFEGWKVMGAVTSVLVGGVWKKREARVI